MSLDARLNRLVPVLTAKERGILVLGSLKSKTPEDTSWRSTMPPSQTTEFNRLIFLMNACNVHLPLYITTIELRTEQLYLRFHWWHSIISLGQQTWRLAQFIPASKQTKAADAISQYYPEAELPWLPDGGERSWLTVEERMEEVILLMLGMLWQDVRAVEIVLDEVAQEFDGEDPLRPVMRGILDRTRKKLSDLHELLSAIKPFELEEPDEDAMGLARTYFEKGLQLMERI